MAPTFELFAAVALIGLMLLQIRLAYLEGLERGELRERAAWIAELRDAERGKPAARHEAEGAEVRTFPYRGEVQ